MLTTTVERILATGVTTVRLSGELTLAAVGEVRTVISKAAGECPTAVIVDLAQMSWTGAPRLTFLAVVSQEAQTNWGVPVLVCEPGAEARRELRNLRTFVALYDHYAEALLAVNAYVPRWIRRRFQPVPSSSAATRAVVDQACQSWGLAHLREPARLVAAELAANAIVHADTAFDLSAGYTGHYLRLAVKDGSGDLPRTAADGSRPGAGRGMRIVTEASTHWGVTPLPSGKIVWALMSARR